MAGEERFLGLQWEDDVSERQCIYWFKGRTQEPDRDLYSEACGPLGRLLNLSVL